MFWLLTTLYVNFIILCLVESLFLLVLFKFQVHKPVPMMKWYVGGSHLLIECFSIDLIDPAGTHLLLMTGQTMLMMQHLQS